MPSWIACRLERTRNWHLKRAELGSNHIVEGWQKKGMFGSRNVVSKMLDGAECNCFQNLTRVTAEKISLDGVMRDLTGPGRLQCP